MATITERFGAGHAGLAPDGTSNPNLAVALRDMIDDVTDIRSKFVTLLGKLDADAGVGDTNYAATCTPAVLKSIKG